MSNPPNFRYSRWHRPDAVRCGRGLSAAAGRSMIRKVIPPQASARVDPVSGAGVDRRCARHFSSRSVDAADGVAVKFNVFLDQRLLARSGNCYFFSICSFFQ
jgi:hypothetical protein